MTQEQYDIILGLLADKIKEQEKTNGLQKWQIERLEKALKEAEAKLSPTKCTKGVHNEIQN